MTNEVPHIPPPYTQPTEDLVLTASDERGADCLEDVLRQFSVTRDGLTLTIQLHAASLSTSLPDVLRVVDACLADNSLAAITVALGDRNYLMAAEGLA